MKLKKRKPGWKESQRRYKEWLNEMNSTSLFGKKSKGVYVPKPTLLVVRNTTNHIPSHPFTGGPALVKGQAKYDNEELAAREEAALKEIEEKKKRVAPLCNKGGYVYIDQGYDLTTLGRKV